jgi:hypothetical protein
MAHHATWRSEPVPQIHPQVIDLKGHASVVLQHHPALDQSQQRPRVP